MFIDHQHEIHFHNVIKCYTQIRQEIIIMQLILGVAFTYGAPYFDLADCVLQARLTDVLKTLSCVIFFSDSMLMTSIGGLKFLVLCSNSLLYV